MTIPLNHTRERTALCIEYAARLRAVSACAASILRGGWRGAGRQRYAEMCEGDRALVKAALEEMRREHRARRAADAERRAA